ncbi:MAG: hypothetical protein ACOCPZ_02935 [Natrialbaceae archaeon]
MSDGLSTGERIAAAGGVLAVLGALLPWTGPGLFDGIGLDGLGQIVVLLLGLVLFGLLYVADWTDFAQLLVVLLGVATVGLAGYTLAGTLGLVGEVADSASLGLYVSILAGVLVLAGGAHGYTDSTPEAGMYSHR